MFHKNRRVLFLVLILILSGCAVMGGASYSAIYGKSQPRDRIVAEVEGGRIDFWHDVKPILDSRCVVCHGCYDAPCQLKLTAIEGLERGATEAGVYNPARLTRAPLTRLFEDSNTVEGWRELKFFPVLNEYEQSKEANQQAGLMYRLLLQKEHYPLPKDAVLSNGDFSFGVSRKESCPTPETFDKSAKKNPLWGMPYALPGLADKEQSVLKQWLKEGAQYTKRKPIDRKFNRSIIKWEKLLNQDSKKDQLTSRYLYEHLFLAHLYFDDVSKTTFFKLVRSSSPPGKPVKIIATRRPYDKPNVDRVYYRFVPELETIVNKSHMPYALNKAREKRWNTLFFEALFSVNSLPGYGAKEGANPFDSFSQLPLTSRYKFLLDEARYTIMSYIKGPVCRGDAAVNVINDRFWVFFLSPDLPFNDDIVSAIMSDVSVLELPSVIEDNYMPLLPWIKYATKERRGAKDGDTFILNAIKEGKLVVDLSLIWNGDAHDGKPRNKNAALTIFRHGDSASVEQGLIGTAPKTAWVIDYTLLERIYYLLVSGYDVYGNVGHQLVSRLHMDFLRMAGERGFLNFLPPESRHKELAFWYRDAKKGALEYLERDSEIEHALKSNINYKTTDHKQELYSLLKAHLGSALSSRRSLNSIGNTKVRQELKRLSTFKGEVTNLLAENSVIEIVGSNKSIFVTLLRNNAHKHITTLLLESKTLLPEENTVTVAKGVVGAYPNVFLRVNEKNLGMFVDSVLSMKATEDYSFLLDQFGIRRTDRKFWQHSDFLHKAFRSENEIEFGVLDYNRLENY